MSTIETVTYEVANCNFSYKSNSCLKNISARLHQGIFYGLIGPNGSGKTTLLRILTGINTPTTGSVHLYDKELSSYSKPDLSRVLSLVPQTFNLEFEYTVFETVMMGRHPFISRFASPSDKDIALVENALTLLDISHLKNRYVTRLSGGERQRVLVARALAQNTKVMILDEATASLDIRHSIDIMKTLRSRVDEEEITVIAAIHDLDLASAFCDELLVLRDGQLLNQGRVNNILNSTMLQNVFSVSADICIAPDKQPHIQYRYTD